MHQHRLHTHAPQWSRAHSVGGSLIGFEGEVSPLGLVHTFAIVLRHGHHDAVTGADVVKQEVTVWMKGFASERIGTREFPAIDYRARGRGGQRGNMADVAADLGEQSFTCFGHCGASLLSVARRSFGGAY